MNLGGLRGIMSVGTGLFVFRVEGGERKRFIYNSLSSWCFCYLWSEGFIVFLNIVVFRNEAFVKDCFLGYIFVFREILVL